MVRSSAAWAETESPAWVEPFDGDYYTQPKSDTETLIERLLDRRETLGVRLSFGRVTVTDLDKAVRWYREILGFHVIAGPAELVGDDSPFGQTIGISDRREWRRH